MTKTEAHKRAFELEQTADRRLCILLVLDETTGHRASNYTIQPELKRRGHGVSREQVKVDMEFLAEKGLLVLEPNEFETLVVGVLSVNGQDAARGDLRVDGVKQPVGL